MNKKLIVAALATVLSVGVANATSTISGVTQGGSGSFDVNPGFVSGDVGYRYYDQFDLGAGDILNLIFQGRINGADRDIESFINLVQDQIKVNGIVNTMRDGNFHNGHAIFISPNGMVVGASGVLNVGQLSVITPTQTKFNGLKGNYNNRTKEDIETLNKISDLREPNNTVNYGGNAAVTIDGIVISRGKVDGQAVNGVDIRGSQVSIGGKIVNGVNNSDSINSLEHATNLFNTLVNTTGLSNGSNIVIQSGAGNNNKIVITGNVVNKDTNGMVAITNHGDSGMDVSGSVRSMQDLKLYNNNANGGFTVSGDLNAGNVMSITNKGANMHITSKSLNAGGNLELVNNGSGALAFEGQAIANGKIDVYNATGSETYINGDITSNGNAVRIVNHNGKLTFEGGSASGTSVSIRNHGAGGMSVGGYVDASEGILLHNTAGDLNLNGQLYAYGDDVTNVVVMNEGTGKLTTTTDSEIYNEYGNIAVKNTATGGMNLNGKIDGEDGELAINNLAGSATVNGTITNIGNVGIVNKDAGTGLTVGADITTEGITKIVNSSGNSGLNVTSDAVVNHTGNLYVINDKGAISITGKLKNADGDLNIALRKDGTFVETYSDSLISNDAGDIVILNKGNTPHSDNGMILNGTIESTAGDVAINNYAGDMQVNGNITVENGGLGIINRAGAVNQSVSATINGGNINIKNYGSGSMTVDGDITHNGRLNVLANEGNLTLSGKIHNTGTDMTYAAARANGDGITATANFAADSTNGGTILIKNITGANGLKFNGKLTSDKGQVEVYNKTGNMTVTGDLTGPTAVILNHGNNVGDLTVTADCDLAGDDVKIVNKGPNEATIEEKHQKYYYEQLKK